MGYRYTRLRTILITALVFLSFQKHLVLINPGHFIGTDGFCFKKTTCEDGSVPFEIKSALKKSFQSCKGHVVWGAFIRNRLFRQCDNKFLNHVFRFQKVLWRGVRRFQHQPIPHFEPA